VLLIGRLLGLVAGITAIVTEWATNFIQPPGFERTLGDIGGRPTWIFLLLIVGAVIAFGAVPWLQQTSVPLATVLLLVAALLSALAAGYATALGIGSAPLHLLGPGAWLTSIDAFVLALVSAFLLLLVLSESVYVRPAPVQPESMAEGWGRAEGAEE
jgi:hypothetical protein